MHFVTIKVIKQIKIGFFYKFTAFLTQLIENYITKQLTKRIENSHILTNSNTRFYFYRRIPKFNI